MNGPSKDQGQETFPTHAQGIKILHLDTGRSLRGGQRQLLRLMEGLMGKGVRCTLGCKIGKLAEEATQRGIEVLPLALRGRQLALAG